MCILHLPSFIYAILLYLCFLKSRISASSNMLDPPNVHRYIIGEESENVAPLLESVQGPDEE